MLASCIDLGQSTTSACGENFFYISAAEKLGFFNVGGIGRKLASVKLASSLFQLVPSHFHREMQVSHLDSPVAQKLPRINRMNKTRI